MQTHTHSKNATNAPKTGLSSDPQKAMQEMMDTIDRMRGVFEQETEVLEKLDTKGFLALQEEKLHTANIYKTNVQEILARKSEMKSISPVLKKELARSQEEFAELSSKNMKALKRMQRTMERLGTKIQRVAKETVNKDRALSYGEGGTIEQNKRKSVSIGVSETA